MLSRTLRTTGARFYSDKPVFSVESFVNRIDALAKNRSSGGKKRWEISGKKQESQQPGQQSRPRRPQQPRTGKPDSAAQKAVRPRSAQPQRRTAGAAASASSAGSHGAVANAKPVDVKTSSRPAVDASHADSFAQPSFTGFTPSIKQATSAKPLTKRRQPFDRRRSRKPAPGRARVAARGNANNRGDARAARDAELQQGVLSGSQALDIVLRNAGSDATGCISVDKLDLRTISSSLVPSSVTYNTRVWSVLNHKNVSEKQIAQLVEEAVQGRLSEAGSTDEAVANALESNRYLDANTRMFLSKVAAGKIPPTQITQH